MWYCGFRCVFVEEVVPEEDIKAAEAVASHSYDCSPTPANVVVPPKRRMSDGLQCGIANAADLLAEEKLAGQGPQSRQNDRFPQ